MAMATRDKFGREYAKLWERQMAMAMRDKFGREYAKLSEFRDGDLVELDGAFTCHPPGKAVVYVVDGKPLFFCSEGRHLLEGQADDGEHCVGVYRL